MRETAESSRIPQVICDGPPPLSSSLQCLRPRRPPVRVVLSRLSVSLVSGLPFYFFPTTRGFLRSHRGGGGEVWLPHSPARDPVLKLPFFSFLSNKCLKTIAEGANKQIHSISPKQTINKAYVFKNIANRSLWENVEDASKKMNHT